MVGAERENFENLGSLDRRKWHFRDVIIYLFRCVIHITYPIRTENISDYRQSLKGRLETLEWSVSAMYVEVLNVQWIGLPLFMMIPVGQMKIFKTPHMHKRSRYDSGCVINTDLFIYLLAMKCSAVTCMHSQLDTVITCRKLNSPVVLIDQARMPNTSTATKLEQLYHGSCHEVYPGCSVISGWCLCRNNV